MISVIIPAYNQGHYLKEAIQSVLDQTHPEFEVMVVDDGSTDQTAEVVRQFSDERIHYHFQPNRGLAGARNAGLRLTQGEFITFLDADDVFLPEKLALLLTEFEHHRDIGLVVGQAIPIDVRGRPVGKRFDSDLPEDSAHWVLGNPLHVGSVMLRRSWQSQIGFFDESLRSYEDWDMWLRLARAGCGMRSIGKPVSLYRFHATQMTKDGRQMTSANFAVLEKVFRDPALPDSWRHLRERAYSLAHLRAAAHQYLVQDYTSATISLTKAVELDPSLRTNNAQRLADHFSAWTELPKTDAPLDFLENIYTHLPSDLAVLSRRRQIDLGRAAMRIAFEAYERRDLRLARVAIGRAFVYQPRWILNRGALSIFVKSHLTK